MEKQFRVRAELYLGDDARPAKKLGAGQEGFVWETTRGSALKIFENEKNYNCELKCYQILDGFGVAKMDGFNIPQLLGSNDEILAIEMTVVTAPYFLDFGKAYFYAPEYPSDAIEHYENPCREDFGEYWPTVQSALYELEMMGIWCVDANRRNINCHGLESPS